VSLPSSPPGPIVPGEEQLERWMRRALELAREAAAAGDVPVGAVAVLDGAIVGEGRNEREATGDPTAHAEILAIRRAAERIGRWRLDGVVLVVTLEPCAMCAGAIVCARIPQVVYGADDPKGGGLVSRYAVGVDGRWNHVARVRGGVLAAECGALLTGFFAERR
jgi:tRNA(adenine34) deaminase